jgi:RNA polymerase sigma factor (sigma-70 family)
LQEQSFDAKRQRAAAIISGDYSRLTSATVFKHSDFKEALAKAISSLPERERLVLSLYYDEELNLREIGEVLGVSEMGGKYTMI